LKSELGLSHYEGRGWRGFHHHATLCIAAYGFLIRERAALPSSAVEIRKEPAVSNRPRPRGAADPTRAPRRKLDRNAQAQADGRPRQNAAAMSVLPSANSTPALSAPFMTQ
jgi:hypothetical protein